MRKIFIAVLLAGTTTPAVAAVAPQEDLAASPRAERTDRPQPRAERVERRQQVIDRAASPRAEPREGRQAQRMAPPRAVRFGTPRHEDDHSTDHPTGSHREYHRDVREEHREFHGTNPSRRDHRRYHRDTQREHVRDHRSWESERRRGSHGGYHGDVEREHRDLHAGDPSRREHRAWHRDVAREHSGLHRAWSTNWRSYPSYDWRDYRNRYSSLFYLPGYYDPYGYGYRRFQVGLSLWPSYYSDRYWFNGDRYRLPPAYGPYRWVRYYDDAVLVNIYTGQVVDVIYSFFW